MDIKLTRQQENWLNSQVVAGRFEDAVNAIDYLIGCDISDNIQHSEYSDKKLKSLWLEGIESGEAIDGPSALNKLQQKYQN